ncbi:LysM peptidoglycan-binding domain-containing protein [Duganella sp. LjRoot269]|jgi:pilus assembly protein FimV
MPVPTRSSIVSFALKTLTGAVASAVLVAATANAAGLGKLTVLSSLGQPLRAEIELTAVSADEAGALVAKLAPAEAFRVANIDFNPTLLSLRFEIEQRNGRQIIRVTSSQPVNEPFVDMLLELNWTGGRMVREYTFLLDPAEMRATQSPQVAAPVDLGRSAAAPAAAPATPAAAPVAPSAPAPARQPAAVSPPAPSSKSASEYTVKAGDNLTRIANQVKPVDVSLDMMLVALYRANPEAFSGNNMNRLKSGQILAVPDSDTIRNTAPEGEARGVVVAHAADFNAYRAKLAGQVANSTPAKEPDATQNVSGKITAKVEEKPNAVNAAKDKLTLSKTTASAPVQGKTGLAVEDKIAKQKELDDAAARIKELEKNTRDLESLMAVKSKTAADAKQASASASAAVSASAAASVEASAPAKPKRTLVVPPKRIAEPSLFETLMDNLNYVGLAAAALLAGAGAMIASRRRKKFVVPAEEPSILGDTAIPSQSLIAEAGGQSVDTNNSVFNSNFAPSASQLDTNEVDPVAEADVYIAYGRDAQAEEILKEALRTHPERHAVRLKLLEIYVTRKDARSFENQASELYSMTRGQGDEWAQAAAMGQSLDPSNPLYSNGSGDGSTMFAAAAPAVAAGAAAAAFSASDFGSDFNAPAPAPAPADGGLDLDLGMDAAPAADGNSMDFGSDMETALPQAADAAISPASVAAESDNLMDFDLGGLSFEPVPAVGAPIEMPAAPAEPDPAEDAFNLAFDTPAPAPAPAAEPAAAPAPAPAAEDLSMDFGLDLPAEAMATAETAKPSASTDPLDLDLMGFDIPDVPAAPAPAVAELSPDDFDLPAAEEITPAPPPAAQEFDLSGIDLDLDSALGGGAAAAATEAAPAHARDDTLSAHHMEMDTKLDLAIAYQEIGDKEGARELLDEVLRGGSDDQIAKANAMRAQLG